MGPVMERVPPGQILTKNAKWPVLHTGLVPEYDLRSWDFRTEFTSPPTYWLGPWTWRRCRSS